MVGSKASRSGGGRAPSSAPLGRFGQSPPVRGFGECPPMRGKSAVKGCRCAISGRFRASVAFGGQSTAHRGGFAAWPRTRRPSLRHIAHWIPFAVLHRASGSFAARPSRTGAPSRRDGTDPHVQAIAPGARVARSPWSPARVLRAIPEGKGLERALVHRIESEPKPRPIPIEAVGRPIHSSSNRQFRPQGAVIWQ